MSARLKEAKGLFLEQVTVTVYLGDGEGQHKLYFLNNVTISALVNI